MKNLKFKKMLSFAVCLALICSICFIPSGVAVSAAYYTNNKLYDFSKDSGTVYSGNVDNSSGTSLQIARAFFTGVNEELDIYNNQQSNKAGTSGFLFNDADGLFELRAEANYTVTFKVKVVSSQVSFKYNNYTYPTSSQLTELKLVYGMPYTYAANAISADSEVGLVVKVGTAKQTFTALQNGVEGTYNVGQWYDFTYNFTTPATFGDNGNALGFSLKSFNGVHILIDNVKVTYNAAITVDPMGGKISKTSFQHSIGDKVNIENPVYKFGYDFDGWYYDKEYTRPFTDEYITEENQDAKLYAKWSATHFSFEGYTPCDQKFGFGEHYFDIIETNEAYHGNKVLHYHYTEEYWSQIRDGSVEEGNAVYYSSRRTAAENNISLKRVDPNSDYVITFKYKMPEGSGDVEVYPATAASNIWISGTAVYHKDSRVILNDDEPNVWKEVRIAFRTGDLERTGGVSVDYARIMLFASNHTYTEVYVDDLYIEKVSGESSVRLQANNGKFSDGSIVKEQKINFGDSIDTLESPSRIDYEFDGWSYDAAGEKPVTTDVIDSTVFRNTLYAKWSVNMGFETYYYDLESPDRENYISENVSIVQENAYQGKYSAKLINNSSNKNHVIALNPVSNKTRYLVSFCYKVDEANAPIDVSFATMNMNINNEEEVTYYPEVYTVATNEAGEGYNIGAVIIETDFAQIGANRLVLLAKSETSSTYTIYFDTITLTEIQDDEGYVIYFDETGSKNKIDVGKLGEKINLYAPTVANAKFAGWYNDKNYTSVYENDAVYSTECKRIYLRIITGENFNDFVVSGQNMSIVEEANGIYYKCLEVTGPSEFSIGTTVSGKKYAVEFDYNLLSASENVVLSAGSTSKTLTTDKVGGGWLNETLVVTDDSSELKFKIAPQTDVKILIDNVIFYEIDEGMSVVEFDQKDGFGEDCVKVGVIGTKVQKPSVSKFNDYAFYGWYLDKTLKTPFVDEYYTAGDKTVYARWASNPVTKTNFEEKNLNDYLTDSNSNRVTYQGGYLCLNKEDETDESDIYAPIVTKNGYVKLESNTTYSLSFLSYYNAYTSGAKMTFGFLTASSESFENSISIGGDVQVKHSYGNRAGYTYFTTGDLDDTNNVLYIKVKSGTKKTTLKLDAFVITRIDEGRNHTFLYDEKNSKLYELDGNIGEKLAYPNIDTDSYVVEGWYNSVDVIDRYEKGVHKNEPVTVLFSRWELNKITFENYHYENSTSRYAFGDDMTLTSDEQYDTLRSLRYSYNYAVNYFETPNNTAGLGRVNDNSTYKITFKYLITEAQSDVDIKFLTAHINNRWAFITNYNEATYRIYSSEIGDGWQEATVYLTTKFESIGASGLYMTFNPLTEGPTVVYIDAVELEYLGTNGAVAAFIGKDGGAVCYKAGKVGESVSAPQNVPAANFAAFNGWYSDKELTEKFNSVTLEAGMNYIYSSWTENTETFDGYTYASNDSNNFAQNSTIKNGEITVTSEKDGLNGFRVGKLDNDTSYKVTFKYKTDADTVFKFATADEVNFYENNTSYNDEGNFFVANSDGTWHTATVYISTAFTYTVPNDEKLNNAENKNADYGDMLYMYFDNEEGSKVAVSEISVKEIEVLSSVGASVLTNEASEKAGSQALRFYFAYPTQNVIGIDVDGEYFNIVERGIVFKNARNTATGVINNNLVTVKPIVLANKDDNGYTSISKTNKFNEYWSYDNKTESVVFSGYVKNFSLKDTRLIGAKGYIKVKDNSGNIYTFYSSDKKTTVKEGVDINNEITQTKVHTLAGVEWSNFTIVNPKMMPYIYGRQIEFLIDYAKTTHNVELVRVNEKAKETTYEIVIGDTKRDASKLVSVENEDQYVIAVRGTKVIIKGGSDLATMQAVESFIEYLKLKDSLGCGADLKDGYTKYYSVSKTEDDYKLTFNDDFNGSLLDTSKWGAYANENINSNVVSPTQLGGKISMRAPSDPGFTTYVSGTVVDRPAFVRDGNAVVTTGRISETDFTFSRMSSFWHMIYQYGIIEFKVKLAPNPVHTSLWMNGAQNGGGAFLDAFGREDRGCMTEYDLVENYGRVNYYASAVHHWWGATSVRDPAHVSLPDQPYGSGTKSQTYIPEEDEINIYDDYHIFTFLWENTGITFAFDGVKYYDLFVTDAHLERVANYIIIGCGMANRDYGSKYDPEIHNDYYETLVDYIRIYQVESMGSRMVWAHNDN